jgi:hypothetical protein
MATQPVQQVDGGSIPTPSLQIPSKAHQRLIRESHALEHDSQIEDKRTLARSLKNAWVREISKADARDIILKYEWLGNMGVTDYTFGIFFGDYLAGAVCFGRTAGTNTAASVCGKEYAHLVKTLNRGACVHWAHPNSASFLITHACRLMTKKGFHIFVAYSDAEAGEIGTVYQASGWHYCQTTKSGSSLFAWSGKPIANDPEWGTFKDGKLHDERNIQHATRNGFRLKCTRKQMRTKMVREGFLFFKSQPKGRYVGVYGTKDEVTELRAALKWQVAAYPKREKK